MFDMQFPWWHFVARAALVYLALMVLMRVCGKRTVGQFTPFDLLVVMLLSESVSASLSGGDNSLAAGLILAGTLIAMNLAISFLAARSKRFLTFLEGEPILVGSNGRIFEDRLRKQNLSVAELEQALREADCDLADMRCAILEADGKISILKKKPG